MSADQIDIIKQYLTIESNHAIIINGEYGIGKTYFCKEVLFPEIKEISLPEVKPKKFRPIHISLFGLKSVEDLQSAIFLELVQLLTNKNIKLAAGVGKTLFRGIVQFTGFGNIDDYVNDLKKEVNNLISYKELVLFFDDLDRKSSSLNLEDVFGFINQLVENEGAKIIIIANETTLSEKEENYKAIKEKVVSVSLRYNPFTENVTNAIILKRYKNANKIYYDYLTKNKKQIVEIVSVNNNNFRSLIFFLENFKSVFYLVHNEIELKADLRNSKDRINEIVLNFTLAVAFEYKTGLVTSNDLTIFDTDDISRSLYNIRRSHKTNSAKEGSESVPSYQETFFQKYFSNRHYMFFRSIFLFLTGAEAINSERLKSELSSIVFEDSISEQEKLLKSFLNPEIINLEDDDYKNLIYKLLKHVDQGNLPLDRYAYAFHFATMYDNPLKFDLDKLKARFKTGIQRGQYQYDERLWRSAYGNSEIEFKDEISEISDYCASINEELELKERKEKLNVLFKHIKINFFEFLQNEKEFAGKTIWLEYTFSKVVSTIRELESSQIIQLAEYFGKRYIPNNPKLDDEKDFVNKLIDSLNKPVRTPNNKMLKNAALKILVEKLKKCQAEFPL